MIKKIFIALLLAFILLQFFRVDKNISPDTPYALKNTYTVPEEVDEILKFACYDCHSNQTRYPWYSNIQPVMWWMDDHVQHGKKDLNFSQFTHRRIAIQNHKFEEIIEVLDENEMPLESYTYMGLHKDANLSEDQKSILKNWAKEQMVLIKNNYPADSLVLRRN